MGYTLLTALVGFVSFMLAAVSIYYGLNGQVANQWLLIIGAAILTIPVWYTSNQAEAENYWRY